MDKLDMKSKNIINENINFIKEYFPNVVVECDGEKRINFEILKQELTDYIAEDTKEKYQLTWPGKKQSIINANTAINKTLRPLKDKSVNFESTKNVYIEGDNLEALKLLQESYLNKIKCIYIDPPYNTGNNLIYKNDFSKTIVEEQLEDGSIDEYGNKLTTNFKTNGRFHSDWLSMMYSRIKLARNLLSPDGFIILAIDDSELSNLDTICSEIFGETNKLGVITVVHKPEGRNQEKFLATSTEYMILYAKDKDKAEFSSVIFDDVVDEKVWQNDSLGMYKLNNYIRGGGGDVNLRVNKPSFWYPVYINPNTYDISLSPIDGYTEIYPITSTGVERTWKTKKETLLEQIKKGEIVAKNENGVLGIYEKYRGGQLVKTHWISKKYNAINCGTKILEDLFGAKYFDFPKSLYLVQDIIKVCTKPGDIVLDFFSGSATTAHAVLDMNVKEDNNCQFILVQLPEPTDEKSAAYKDGYMSICDIGEERIRRVISNLSDDLLASNKDLGFRVFKIDSSNMKDIYYKPGELTQSNLFDYMSNIKEDRTSEDLLIQVILDLGLTLDLKIEKKNILNNNVYFVADNSLVACFDNQVNIDIIDEICKCNPLKMVFKDISFKTDKDKINLEERIKKLSPDTEISIL